MQLPQTSQGKFAAVPLRTAQPWGQGVHIWDLISLSCNTVNAAADRLQAADEQQLWDRH